MAENPCSVCESELAGTDVEYHYSRCHDYSGRDIPWQVWVLSHRESMRTIGQMLDALKGLRERCDYSDLRAWADDVIAKAEGRA